MITEIVNELLWTGLGMIGLYTLFLAMASAGIDWLWDVGA